MGYISEQMIVKILLNDLVAHKTTQKKRKES